MKTLDDDIPHFEDDWRPTCMVCAADVEDRGSMRTWYRCDECIATNRKIGEPCQSREVP